MALVIVVTAALGIRGFYYTSVTRTGGCICCEK